MAQGKPSSSPSTNTHTYDVFLSFRGEDTRYGFTGNLYLALSQRGVSTFIDDNDLKKGEEITPSLLNAIQNSRMAIIIFSKNYASSTFCLNELVQILQCHTKEKMWILPVFYDVEPSEVRHQTGDYGKALAKHERGRFKDDKEKVKRWRSALSKVADLSGSDLKYGREYEYEFIKKIIEEVSRKLNRPFLHIADYPIGLEARIQDIQTLIGAEHNNKVNMLGICGNGGIGKSTLARAIYNLKADQFEGSCFLANVREKSTTRRGLEKIQETMLSELVGDNNIKLRDVHQGIPILRKRLHQKKVLLILDDVDHKKQLEATVGRFDWFGLGSIIIITTRNKHLLDIHGVEKQHEVKKFNDTEALELFKQNAFKNGKADRSYSKIIKRAINYCSGLPLALKIIGSNLFGKTLDEWESALEAYERIPNRDVQEILRVSYVDLEENEKEIFLDIACFFNGCTLRYVTNVLNCRGFQAKDGIKMLEKKSLINIWGSFEYNDDIVTMHSLIQSMGKELVRQQSTWTGKRTRLWFHEDVICFLEKNKENDKIEVMMLDMPRDKEVQWNEEVLGKMKNIKMFIKRKGCVLGSPKHLPNSLRVLEWWEYPATSLPSNVHSKNLVILNLSHSFFEWETPLEESKVLRQLNFTGCKNIRQIPDVSGFPNLMELCIDDCTNLIEIHDSVGFLDKLQTLSAKGCIKLNTGLRGMKLTSLEYLCLRGCNSLITFPEILGPMNKLKSVDLGWTALKTLPASTYDLQGLEMLNMTGCKTLKSNAAIKCIPLNKIKSVELGWIALETLPACLQGLEMLSLMGCKTLESKEAIKCIQILDMIMQLGQIRGLPPSEFSFYAHTCTSLKVGCSTLNTWLQNGAITFTLSNSCIQPGQSIPEWFDLFSCIGNSTRFWFPNLADGILFSENEWNYGEVVFEMVKPSNLDSGYSGSIKWTRVNRTFTRMEDVRFTNLYPPKSTPDDSSYSNGDTFLSEAPNIQRDWVPMRPPEEQCLNYEYSNSDSLELAWPIDEAFLDHQANVPGESSKAPGCVELQNNQVQSLTSSSGQVRRELHLGTSSTVLSTTVDASLRNQTELTQDDDVEMKAFYASLDAETYVISHSHDQLATTAPSEEAKEAFKIVQDFISNDASVLLHPEQCSVMKTSLEYLSNLSVDDGISTEMRTLISEASREFTHWSKDYIEASVTIESTASELHRGDELEAGLEANKQQFSEDVALEDELLQKLAMLEERKKDLEEQINVIKADISASETEKNIARQRKRDIFQEGKMLKAQRDELRKNTPRLQQEHGMAKERQIRIQADWSKLREKFK